MNNAAVMDRSAIVRYIESMRFASMQVTSLIFGCGYLGRRVAKLWVQEGGRVRAATRQAPPPGAFARMGVQPLMCDVMNPAHLDQLPQVDTVLYAIGFDRASGASMRDVYVQGLANVLERLPPPGRFIYVSSTSVYGQADGEWVDEDAPTTPQEESGRIVLDAENLLRERLPQAIILRFAGIYGPGRLLRQKAIQAGEPITGDGDKWLNLIHADDGAQAILAAESQGSPGRIYNVCDGRPVRRREFFGELARLLNAPPPRFVDLPPDVPAPPHEKGHRRIDNRRLREELQVHLRYPSYVDGLAASCVDL